MPKPKPDTFDDDILAAYDSGQLRSVATKSELAKFKAAARRPSGPPRQASAFRPETCRTSRFARWRKACPTKP